MNKYYFHVHSRRCGHAEDVSDEAYIKRALELGASDIYFSDHAPFPGNPFGNRMDYVQLPEYIHTLHNLKEQYDGIINVHIGLEIEYLPSFLSYYEELQDRLDFMLLGQHFCEVSPLRYSFQDVLKDEYKYLGQSICQGMETDFFQYVAHPDRCFRYEDIWSKKCEAVAYDMIQTALHHHIILEQNLASMKQPNYYRKEFWNLLEPGNEIILGTDAHKLIDLR